MPPLDGTADTSAVAENIIPQLLQEIYTEQASGRHEMPMAALCKRVGVRMSTLQRYLTMLEGHGLVTVHCDEAGRWTTKMTEQGVSLFESMAA